MLGRLLQPLPLRVSRRAYSIFSSKPGGGRYFNSAKPHKVTPAAATAHAKSQPRPDEASPSPSPTSASAPDDSPSKVLSQEDAPMAMPSQPSPSAFSSGASPSPLPHLPPHPTFSSHTYPLHHFFSLHRPLLLLPLSTSTLFESPSTPFNEATSSSPRETNTLPFDDIPETSADADADAARQLARALALNRVGGWIDWEETLARLGDPESIRALQGSIPVFGVNMDSVKRKRRKKMSKHKYKKRRRLQRSERRKMGK